MTGPGKADYLAVERMIEIIREAVESQYSGHLKKLTGIEGIPLKLRFDIFNIIVYKDSRLSYIVVIGRFKMAQKQSKLLTSSEWKIMRIVWAKKSGDSRDFCREAGEKYDWSSSTVKTLLSRLVQKGFLKTTRIGNSFLYEPAKPALSTLYAAADYFLDNIVHGTKGPLLSYMVKKSRLSPEEVSELLSVLNDYKEE